MKQPLKLLWMAAIASATLVAGSALAQPKPKGGDKGKQPDVEELGGDEGTTPPTTPETGTGTAGTGAETGAAGGDEGASFICEANPEACQTDKLLRDYSERELKDAQVYAVQQIYALRHRRVELSPYYGVSMNDQFVSHSGPGLSVNYYVTNVLAVGFNFNYYFNSDAAFNKEVRESSRLAIPINQYQWGANLNFTYVPLYGKFAGFGDFIFHWDTYIVGGIGAISTRPEAVIDPDNRKFDFQPKIAFNAGLGLRIFFNRWFAANLELRDYIYNEKLENTCDADCLTRAGSNPKDDANWFGESRITNAVQAQFGISIFLPFTWTYRLPK